MERNICFYSRSKSIKNCELFFSPFAAGMVVMVAVVEVVERELASVQKKECRWMGTAVLAADSSSIYLVFQKK